MGENLEVSSQSSSEDEANVCTGFGVDCPGPDMPGVGKQMK